LQETNRSAPKNIDRKYQKSQRKDYFLMYQAYCLKICPRGSHKGMKSQQKGGKENG